jgi:hypothetical protein
MSEVDKNRRYHDQPGVEQDPVADTLGMAGRYKREGDGMDRRAGEENVLSDTSLRHIVHRERWRIQKELNSK